MEHGEDVLLAFAALGIALGGAAGGLLPARKTGDARSRGLMALMLAIGALGAAPGAAFYLLGLPRSEWAMWPALLGFMAGVLAALSIATAWKLRLALSAILYAVIAVGVFVAFLGSLGVATVAGLTVFSGAQGGGPSFLLYAGVLAVLFVLFTLYAMALAFRTKGRISTASP